MEERSLGTGAGPSPDGGSIESRVVAVLRTIRDPEIPVDIWNLGLVYEVVVSPAGEVAIKMTLTAPGCPVAGLLVGEVESRLKSLPGVRAARVELVWDPSWSPEMMSEAARLELGFL